MSEYELTTAQEEVVAILQARITELQAYKDAVLDFAVVHWTYDPALTPREQILTAVAQIMREGADPLISAEAHQQVQAALRTTLQPLCQALKDGDLSDCCYGGSCVADKVMQRLQTILNTDQA